MPHVPYAQRSSRPRCGLRGLRTYWLHLQAVPEAASKGALQSSEGVELRPTRAGLGDLGRLGGARGLALHLLVAREERVFLCPLRPYFANRTTAFTTCAALNCGEPVPFIDGPMKFHYEASALAHFSELTRRWRPPKQIPISPGSILSHPPRPQRSVTPGACH